MEGRQIELSELKDKMEAEKLLFSLVENKNNVINCVENLSLLVNAVRQKPDINSKKNGRTPLMLAVSKRRTDLLKVLLDAKADMSIKDPNGYKALEYASLCGYREGFKIMVEHKPDGIGGDSPRPFTLAARLGNADIIRALLDAKADVNFQEKDGDTVLMAAARHYRSTADTIKILLDAKADVTIKNIHGRTALDQVDTYREKERGLKILLEQAMKEAIPATPIINEPKNSLKETDNNEKQGGWFLEHFGNKVKGKARKHTRPYIQFNDEGSERSRSLLDSKMRNHL